MQNTVFRLIVAHSDTDTRIRNETDNLLAKLVNGYSCILSLEVTTEVELVVGLAWESNDIRHSSRQQWIARIGATLLVIGLIRVEIIILLVVDSTILIVVIPQEGVIDCLAVTTCCFRIEERSLGNFRFTFFHNSDVLELTQPVFMANLGICVVLADLTTTIEVTNLTLDVGSN